MYKLSIIILSNAEVESLKETLIQFVNLLRVHYEMIVLLKSADCPSATAVKEIMELHPDWKLSYCIQKSNNKIELFQEATALAKGTHVLIWTSDNEVEAKGATALAEISIQKPNAVVSLSKFHKDSVLVDYGTIRTAVRKFLNRIVRFLYKREGEDFYSTFQIMPRCCLQKYRYSDSKNFIFEYSLIPLKMGVEYIELPMVYHKRTEGKSNFSWLFNFKFSLLYIYNIFKISITPRKKLLLPQVNEKQEKQ